MLTPSTLPSNATFGLLKVVWSNGTNDLPPGVITVGQPGPAANPGIEALPFLNSASTPNTWQFTQAQGYAPAGTTQVSFFALFVDQSAGIGYFDDLNATRIPEPTSLALLGLATIGGAALIRRRRSVIWRMEWKCNSAHMAPLRLFEGATAAGAVAGFGCSLGVAGE